MYAKVYKPSGLILLAMKVTNAFMVGCCCRLPPPLLLLLPPASLMLAAPCSNAVLAGCTCILMPHCNWPAAHCVSDTHGVLQWHGSCKSWQ